MDDIVTGASDPSVAAAGDIRSSALASNFPARAQLSAEDIRAAVEPIIIQTTH